MKKIPESIQRIINNYIQKISKEAEKVLSKSPSPWFTSNIEGVYE
jgi:hypothetical protein